MERCYYTALGDSISNGFTAYIFNGFTFRLFKFLKCRYGDVVFCNKAKPAITSCDLFCQLKESCSTRKAVKRSDIITITIGGNNLLNCVYDNYHQINKKAANEELDKFKRGWICILDCIRNELCSYSDIYVMTLYNPYCCCDKNYELADYYISQLNNIITDSFLINYYRYCVVDIYSLFEKNKKKDDTFFNTIIRNPHPNSKGCYKIAREFIRCIRTI